MVVEASKVGVGCEESVRREDGVGCEEGVGREESVRCEVGVGCDDGGECTAGDWFLSKSFTCKERKEPL